LLVYGDYDASRISHATRFFELLGGGTLDGGWQGEAPPNRFAVLQGTTHYYMNDSTRMAEEVVRFLDSQ